MKKLLLSPAAAGWGGTHPVRIGCGGGR